MNNIKNMDDSYDNTNIRAPDKIIKERLIPDNKNDYQKQIDYAIQESIKEMCDIQNNNINYETTILNEHKIEKEKRTEKLKDLTLILKKLSVFDKQMTEIYEILKNIIDLYCDQIISVCELDEETYNKIFSSVKSIRNSDKWLEELSKIIIKSSV